MSLGDGQQITWSCRAPLLHSPFDVESSDPRFVCKKVSSHPLDDGFGRRFGVQLVAVVLVVHVVSHTDEFSPIVAARKQDDGDAENVRGRDSLEVGRVGFEDELVDADRDGANQQRIKLLVMFGPANANASVPGT